MCGITGLWSFESADSTRQLVTTMNDALEHRGPDDEGVEVLTVGARQLGLGARRLAIQDLSPAGHQPMHDRQTGNWVALNGEIYNFRTIRGDLEARGRTFRSGSDTEVLLQAYDAWGIKEALRRLRGMFAFALWDAAKGRLILARDRLGVKPLYYAQTTAGLVFSSEVRSLLKSKLVTPRLSMDGLRGYLALGAVQEPHTLVEGVRSLPPGSYAVVENDTLTITAYWSLFDCFRSNQPPAPRAEIVRYLRVLLSEAINLRLISDAPVGVFLSGGLDSTAIVALAAQAGTSHLRTVSVVFPDVAELSEHDYIRQVVERYGTDHTQLELSGDDLLKMLPATVDAMDQPSVDGTNTFVVAQQARAAGLTVALSGIGGDELFGGYPSFRRIPRMNAVRSWLPTPVGRAAADVLMLTRDNDQTRKLGRWLARRDLDNGAMALSRELFSPTDRFRLLSGRVSPWQVDLPRTDGLDPFNAISYFELTQYLRNVLLHDSDVMGMAHSLEIREPLLDHVLIEYVAGLDGETKRAGSGPKPLLVEALGTDLPAGIINRPKMGFVLPFATWMRGPLRETVESVLLDPRAGGQVADALDSAHVARIWDRFLEGKGTWVRPWALYALKSWGERCLA